MRHPTPSTSLLVAACALLYTACEGEIQLDDLDTADQRDPSVVLAPTIPEGTPGGLESSQPMPFAEGEECAPHEEFFQEEVFAQVMENWCVGCHSAEGVAAGTRLVMEAERPLAVDAEPIQRTPEERAALRKRNYDAAALVASDLSQGVSMLLLKPTNQIEHIGGAMIRQDTDNYRTLATFVARVNGEATECAQPTTYLCDQENPWPGYRRLRRLSHEEYDRTLTDLLGREVRAGENFAADVEVRGYLNNADALKASTVLLEQWLNTAEILAETYIADLSSALPCAASSPDRACAETFVRTFGERAFRRPIESGDVTRYLGLFDKITGSLSFEDGIHDVMVAILISPHFLYRFELGSEDAQTGSYALGPYEVANQLSYLITGTMPDEELMSAAHDGSLGTPEGVEAQAKRLLRSEQGKKSFEKFIFKWLHLDRFTSIVRDGELYPEFSNDIREKMLAEAKAFISDAYDGGQGSLRDVLTRAQTRVDAQLAAYYGLPDGAVPDDGQTHLVSLGPDRAGALGLGAFLTTHALGDGSSPVRRGELVRERLLCQELPPPPPSLDVTLGFEDPNAVPRTTRERFAAHSENPSCAGCHRLVDPIGFAMEHYDGVGRYRDVYEKGGQVIDATGAIISSKYSDAELDGLGSLTTALANGADAPACFTEQMMHFGYAISDSFAHGCNQELLEDRFVQGDLSFEELLVGMTQLPHFAQRAPDHWT
ncbi:MAG: DUF1592 domain-containing protein, partial [Myxococcota bacterium]